MAMDRSSEEGRILRALLFALRHDPWQFGIVLDDDGFADLNELTIAFRFSRYDWALLERSAVEAICSTDPGRFEMRDNKVRARYGHSIRLALPSEPRTPPEFLFHGTAKEFLPTILQHGLRPMNRAFVHLTSNPDYAGQVVEAKGGGEVLRVKTKEANSAGIEFFQANPHVWLVRGLPAELIVPASIPFRTEDQSTPANRDRCRKLIQE
jgi:putative RNA 2'-phosphotransferase